MKKTVLVQGLVATAVAALLVACGGGGGAPYPNGGGNGGTATPTPPGTAASRVEVMLDKLTLPSSGAEFSTLTVTTVNAQGNTVAGVPVTVAIDGGVFTPTSAGGVSDASGAYTGKVQLGGNRSNRAITVTVTAQGALPVSNQIIVTGSSMVVNGLPSAVAAGGGAQGVTLKVLDSAGQPIAGQDVALLQALPTGVTLSPVFPAKTDGSGQIVFNLTVASNAPVGDSILGFVVGDPTSASSIKASRPLSITGAGSGSGVPDVPANTVVSSATVGAVPTFITVNSAGDVTNKSKITARFLNPANAGIADMRVRFTISSNPLGAEQLLPNDVNKGGTVRTYTTFANADGIAEVSYAPGERSSPTDGVKVSACYAFTDADLVSNCTPVSIPASLTVGGKPLSISIFDGNTLGSVGTGHQIYQQTLYIQVVDAGGNIVPNADFSGSVDITEYLKGANWTAGANGNVPPATANICPNEDTNRNGSIDAGEDINGNGRLDPRKADVSIAFPAGRKTDSSGFGTVQVSWGQNVATWLNYVVTISANADSSEGTAQRSFVTTYIEGDQKNGTFLTAPYGSGPCNSPN